MLQDKWMEIMKIALEGTKFPMNWRKLFENKPIASSLIVLFEAKCLFKISLLHQNTSRDIRQRCDSLANFISFSSVQERHKGFGRG